MAELNLDQITSKLEDLLQGEPHFVFWYDANHEFADNIDELRQRLDVQIIELAPDAQFKTKLALVELERQGRTALVYSPAPQPPLRENFLADMLRYSPTFTADAAVMLRDQLGLPSSDLKFVKTQQKFFANKERKQRFANLYQVGKNPELTEMAALTKASEVTLSAVLRAVLHGGLAEDNPALVELAKYDLTPTFWQFVTEAFGYQNKHLTLKHLMTAMLLNFAYDQLNRDLPTTFSDYELLHYANAVSFIQNSRNIKTSEEDIQRIAEEVWNFAKLEPIFRKLKIEDLVRIDAFPEVDQLIIGWLATRLLAGDVAVLVNKRTIGQVVEDRLRLAYGHLYRDAYTMLRCAAGILAFVQPAPPETMDEAISAYVDSSFQIDQQYRQFVTSSMKLNSDQELLVEGVRERVESAYLNGFLQQSISGWQAVYDPTQIPQNERQRNFYSHFVATNGDARTVVIISDAFRFEAAKELQQQLNQSDKYQTTMNWLITGLPSVTYFGIPALLPNLRLAYHEKKNVTVDEMPTVTTVQREAILQATNQASVAASLTDFLAWSSTQRKSFLAGQKVVYLFHNQVDTTGESAQRESAVFEATQAAIAELSRAIELLRNVSVRNILVTADHGFIYRRSALDETNKIEIQVGPDDKKEQRYAITQAPIKETGVAQQRLGTLLDNDDPRWVNYPTNFNIFKAPGAGQNYYHGGASLQEMLTPVLSVATASGRSLAEPATIHDVTATRRITSREVVVTLMQDQPVSDTVTPGHYLVYFTDDQHQQISGEINFVADSTDAVATGRIETVRLTLHEAEYVNGRQYQLVLHNEENDTETTSDYEMDMMIQGGFDFDI